MTIASRGIQFKYLGRAFKQIFKKNDAEGELSGFAALCTALSATIGTGNIAGVATAIVAGGPGPGDASRNSRESRTDFAAGGGDCRSLESGCRAAVPCRSCGCGRRFPDADGWSIVASGIDVGRGEEIIRFITYYYRQCWLLYE